jgi:hypothetical protein
MATKKVSASPSSKGIKKSAPKKADVTKSVEKPKVAARKNGRQEKPAPSWLHHSCWNPKNPKQIR